MTRSLAAALRYLLMSGLLAAASSSVLLSAELAQRPQSDDRTYRNPVLFGDYSDPDVIRVGDDYYMVSSSFQCVPGLPILHSTDLVSWAIVGHAAEKLPSPDFDAPQHGKGLWAPSLRYHDGFFWIYVGDPDRGILRTRARDPRGPWEPLTIVKAVKGWIDPCPLWDDDGSMYLVHAWAKSRAGFNGVLTVNRLSADGRQVIDEGTLVFDGGERQPTIEGPKFYKRNGWYYIFAPAGGVKTGWQTVLRSKNLFGPYEDKVVLDQGSTALNGPHQGAWVETPEGESWFVHFQDRGAYGRVVDLEPMTWLNEWPVIGEDRNGDGKGEPVVTWTRPRVSAVAGAATLQTSDEFNDQRLGLQWQWHGNPAPQWFSLHARRGFIRLTAIPPPPIVAADFSPPAASSEVGRTEVRRHTEVRSDRPNLWFATNLLLQKLPAPSFAATASLDPSGLRIGERAGLVIMGADYTALVVSRTEAGYVLQRVVSREADKGGAENIVAGTPANAASLQLRVTVTPEAICRFSFSRDGGAHFAPIGGAFVARAGRWIGAKVGLFASAPAPAKRNGYAEFDWFHVEPARASEAASLIVAQDGSGDYRTIQAALDAIPSDNSVDRTILIRNGTYRQKLFIRTSHVSLVGEDRERTRIEYAELRRNWRASHPDDWGAAVVNIATDVSDIVIANLTVRNDYGNAHDDHDHQFAIRSMDNATRIAILNANVIAEGGDTVSLWNSEAGLSYYNDSYFEGWVDYLCPRGWAYATGSRFFGHNENASIWHDGGKNEDSKFVIRHSRFDGVPGFALGRNHRDAQFYLIDDVFSAAMADRPIYSAPAPDPLQWGERRYYAGCRREGGDFPWFKDNLRTATGSPRDEDITAEWTFGGRWDPATLPPVLPLAAIPRPENGWKWVDPAGVPLRWTAGRNAIGQRVYFGRSESPDLRAEQTATTFATGPLEPGRTYYWRVDTMTADGLVTGPLWSFRADPRTMRIALAGDSTVTERTGWGRGFKAQIADSAAVINLARGGRSSKSYANEGHWAEVLKGKPSYVLIQFGHNDVPGKGLDRETNLPLFRANMTRYVDEARAAGAEPILVTPLTRRYFGADGRIKSDLVEYAEATRQVAAEKKAPLVDLHAKSIELLESLGSSIAPAISPLKFDGTIDRTHLNEEGSALFGALMAQEVQRVVPQLAPYIAAAELPSVTPPWSVRVADSVMRRTPDPLLLDVTETPKWDYTQGLLLLAIQQLARRNVDDRYDAYVKKYYDGMIDSEGRIRAYKLEEYSLDRINAGKVLFALYEKTREEKYRKAIETLRQQLRGHPRNSDGGFWHKKRYPHQMWLDGLYMGAPFLAQYAKTFNEPAAFDDVITQFVLMEKHARDEKSGLLYHGWDESRQQKWADPQTGRSPAFWGRAMGWYAMGLVETLDFIPRDHPRRGELIAILQRLAEAVTRVQDPKSAVWWQVLDQPGREGNYLEASVSTMFAFTLLKASRLGYIDATYGSAGRRAWAGILKEFVTIDKDGLVDINHVCQVAGLGGDPEKERYRDGTYDYYVHEKVRSNDPKAVGPFMFAAMEMERN